MKDFTNLPSIYCEFFLRSSADITIAKNNNLNVSRILTKIPCIMFVR